MSASPRPLAFLDRDGTLNREQGFITRPEDLLLLPGAAAAVSQLQALGYLPVVVTSQSGIARGLYGHRELARIHARMQAELGGQIRAYLHCPHHPDMPGPYGGPCPCRKPGPGLLDQAATLFPVAWERSVLIGDSARDLLMGRERPLTRILLRSGKPWQAELDKLRAADCSPHKVCDDLPAAAAWLAGPPAD